MTTAPKISIIIPIYNTAPYLRKCLDSVVGQTLQEIQIICVDRSSTDGSRQIIEEYAARDERIQIVECENTPGGGPGQTRNVGLPHVRGKYLYFIDSDDWIDPKLCEKAYYRLESTGADIVFFHFDQEVYGRKRDIRQSPPLDYCRWSVLSSQTADDFIDFACAPWTRVVRTTFFQSIGVRFPEEKLPDDLYVHRVLLVNEPRVELIPEKLYCWRLHEKSVSGRMGELMAKDCLACSLIKNYLLNIGKYEQYRDLLLVRKFTVFLKYYPSLRKDVQPDAIRWLRESLDDEEMDFLRNDERVKPHVRDSILYLLGNKSLRWRVEWNRFNQCVLRPIIVKPIERIVKSLTLRQKNVMRQKNVISLELRIHELSEQLAQRDQTIVHLRNQQN